MALAIPAIRQLGNSHFPCPSGNNTQIGDVQKFNLFCGIDVGGVEIDRMQSDTLNTCINICTSHQVPRCDAVTFRTDNVCIFKSGVTTASSQPQSVAGADSAIGILPDPPPSSRCDSLGTGMIQLVAAKNFSLQCGQVFAGNDIEQQFQPSFDACLSACAAMTACGGVSFDIQQSQGFKNCYLKTKVTTGGLLTRSGVDSAFVAVDHSAPTVPSSSVITPGSVPVATKVAPESSSPSISTLAASSSLASGMSKPLSLAETNATSSSVPENTNAPATQEAAASSDAWIAAPIIGSLAAVALIVGILILLRRRIQAQPFLPFFKSRGKDTSRSQAPFSGHKLEDEEAARSGSAMSSRGAGSARSGGSRNSILVTRTLSHDIGIPQEHGPDGDHEPLIDIVELEEIMDKRGTSGPRDSQNGLKLNGVSLRSTNNEIVPGIPVGFSGPENHVTKERPVSS